MKMITEGTLKTNIKQQRSSARSSQPQPMKRTNVDVPDPLKEAFARAVEYVVINGCGEKHEIPVGLSDSNETPNAKNQGLPKAVPLD